MKVWLLDRDYGLQAEYDAAPDCGEDFCDTCGDCLHCYPDDPCAIAGSGRRHTWYAYWESHDTFLQRHPEATAVPAVPNGVTT